MTVCNGSQMLCSKRHSIQQGTKPHGPCGPNLTGERGDEKLISNFYGNHPTLRRILFKII